MGGMVISDGYRAISIRLYRLIFFEKMSNIFKFELAGRNICSQNLIEYVSWLKIL